MQSQFPTEKIAATSRPDAKWGDAVVIAITNPDITLAKLQSALGEIAHISTVLYLSELPTIGIGKIDREQLKKMAREA